MDQAFARPRFEAAFLIVVSGFALLLGLMGLVLGGGLAVLVARVMVHLIFGVTPYDPMTILSLLGVLTVFTGFASFVPAARISRLDPARILREGSSLTG